MTRLRARLRLWWLTDRSALVRAVGLVASLLAYLWLWPSLIEVGGVGPWWANTVVHTYVLAWMLLATMAVRTVGVRHVIGAWMLGTFLVPTLVFVPGIPIRNWLGTSRELAIYAAPLLEETALVLALGLMVWRLTRRPGRRPAIADLVVLGFAIGGGYAVHEDALYGRFLPALLTERIGDAFIAPYGWLFPTFTANVGPGVFSYHAGHGAFFGLVIGLSLLLRRRHPAVTWLLPVAWVYAVLDHGVANLEFETGPTAWRFLLASGQVVSTIVFLAIPAALAIDLHVRRHANLTVLPVGRSDLRWIMQDRAHPGERLVRLLSLGNLHRVRNAVVIARWRAPDREFPDDPGLSIWQGAAFRGLGEAPESTTPEPATAESATAESTTAASTTAASTTPAPSTAPPGAPTSAPTHPSADGSTSAPPTDAPRFSPPPTS